MKKYKFEFDYKTIDAVMIAWNCIWVSSIIMLITNLLSEMFGGYFQFLAAFFIVLGYIASFIYTIIYVIRYVLEGTTIIEVKSEE